MRKTKLGVHHMMNGGDTREWSQVATGLLCVNDFGPALEVPPGTRLVGRAQDHGKLWGQGFDFNRHCLQDGMPPDDMATYYFEFVLREAIARNPLYLYWVGPNEQVFIWSKEIESPVIDGQPNPRYDALAAATLQGNRETVMRWYGEFNYSLARILYYHGKRLVFGNWSVGHPHKAWNLWRFYTRALQACRDWRAVHASHAYGPLNEDSALRYRWDYREFKRLGYASTPFMLTEAGAEKEGGMLPWKDEFDGNAQRYFDEWVKLFALLIEEDDFVSDAFLFSSGNGAADAWKPYDITGAGLARRVVDWCTSRDPLEIGDLMPEMTQEDLQAVDAAGAVIEAEVGKIRAIAAKYIAAPWWESWPEGAYPAPGRALAIPNRVMTFYRADGRPFNPQPFAGRIINWTMRVVEKRGGLLNVHDLPGQDNDLWVKSADVQPE